MGCRRYSESRGMKGEVGPDWRWSADPPHTRTEGRVEMCDRSLCPCLYRIGGCCSDGMRVVSDIAKLDVEV